MEAKTKRGLSIGTKLLLGVIFIVIVLGGFGVYLTNTLNEVRGSFSEIDSRFSALKEITSIENVNNILAGAVDAYLETGDVAWEEVYDQTSFELDLRTENLTNDIGAGTDNLFAQYLLVSEELRATELLILALRRSGDVTRAQAIFSGTYMEQQIAAFEILALLQSDMEEGVSEIIQQNRILIIFSENVLLAAMIVLIFLITLVTLTFSYLLSSSIQKVKTSVEQIIDGDLHTRVQVHSRDEIGQLAASFNEMTRRLSNSYEGLEKKIADKTAALRKNVTQVNSANAELERSKLALMNVMGDLKEEKTHLAQAKARDEAILESIGDGMVVANREGKILFVNAQAAELLACKESDLEGRDLSEAISLKDEKGAPVPMDKRPVETALSTQEKVQSSDYYYERTRGGVFPVSVTATPIVLNEQSIGAVMIFRDITKEKEVDKAKTEFVSLASHQLKAPLTAIKWNAELLLEDAKEFPEERREAIENLIASNAHMIDLVNNLLNISRIEKGTFMIEPELADVREIADSVLTDYTSTIKEKNLNVNRRYPKVLKAMSVDPNLTRIVFQNLISNGIKYTPEGGSVDVAFEPTDKELIFSVKDSGIGIRKADQARVFEKMFRSENAREKQIEGNGLGLYMVKSIVEKFRGRIWFESTEDVGTTFFVAIPIEGMKKKEGTKALT